MASSTGVRKLRRGRRSDSMVDRTILNSKANRYLPAKSWTLRWAEFLRIGWFAGMWDPEVGPRGAAEARGEGLKPVRD